MFICHAHHQQQRQRYPGAHSSTGQEKPCKLSMQHLSVLQSHPIQCPQVSNLFDNLPALAPPKPADLGSELDHYLSSDVEYVTDPLDWWYKQRRTYPQFSRMALDYLTIPGEFHYCLLLFILLTLLQLRLLMSNGYSAVVASSFHMFAPSYLHNPCVHSSALVSGAK